MTKKIMMYFLSHFDFTICVKINKQEMILKEYSMRV